MKTKKKPNSFSLSSPDVLKGSTGEQLAELQGIFLAAALGCGRKRLSTSGSRIIRQAWSGAAKAKDSSSVTQMESIMLKKLDVNIHVGFSFFNYIGFNNCMLI